MSHSNTDVNISKFENLVMFLMLCISGNPVFIYMESKYLYVVSAVIMFGLCVLKKKKLSSHKLFFWIVCTCVLFLFQNIILELTSINAEMNFLIRLYLSFLCASFFDFKFREVYFKVMVMICLISIPFYILQIGGITFGFEFDRYFTMVFFNSIIPRGIDYHARNSGMFWEPGAFQGFIMLVPLLYSDSLKQLWNRHKKGCLILLIAFVTTQSTTGYITFSMFVFLTIVFNTSKINIMTKSLLIMLTVIIFSYIWSQDFIGTKVLEQYEEALAIQEGDVSWNRMGAMIIDIDNILRHPFIGNGFMDDSRYGILGEYMKGTGNGFTGAINMFGVPFIALYFIGIYQNLRYISKVNRIIFLFIIVLLLNGEYFLNYHLFWSLLFIGIPVKKTINNKQLVVCS